MKNRVLVTGASGMLGKYLCPLLREKYDLYSFSHKNLDVTDITHIKKIYAKIKPYITFHLAAMTNVDLCEKEPGNAKKVNYIGTKNIAEQCAIYNSKMVYLSTGMVFDGLKEKSYTENDIVTSSCNVYGKTKYQGEKTVIEKVKEYYIIRTTWLFGGQKNDKKFVQKILNLATKSNFLQVVDDKWGSPTYTHDLAKSILHLLDHAKYGLYHLANKGSCNRFEFAKKIIEYSNICCELEPVDSSIFPTIASRPYNEKISSIKTTALRSWELALKEYLEN